jgi:hypothetical protein
MDVTALRVPCATESYTTMKSEFMLQKIRSKSTRLIHILRTHSPISRYDKLRVLKLLSADPGFRWCLSPECDSGQLYDDTEYLDPHIICEECGFESCFTHAVPWHEGQSCDQFESQREHGDPEYAQTQNWIRQNSKPCPGCSANVEKDAGCFHMTCEYLLPVVRVSPDWCAQVARVVTSSAGSVWQTGTISIPMRADTMREPITRAVGSGPETSSPLRYREMTFRRR